MNWQDTLIDLILLESRDCPQEKNCYINDILHFVDKTIERKLAEQETDFKKLLDSKEAHYKLREKLVIDEERKRRKLEKCKTAEVNYKWGRLAERKELKEKIEKEWDNIFSSEWVGSGIDYPKNQAEKEYQYIKNRVKDQILTILKPPKAIAISGWGEL